MKPSDTQSLFKTSLFPVNSDPQSILTLKPSLKSATQPTGGLTLEQAFEIYHKGYIARLTEALRETYEAVYWVVGEELFGELCEKFIAVQTSVTYNLSDYGESFPEFLTQSPLTKGIPFLGDLGHFEWTCKELTHAPPSDPMPVERVQELLHAEDFKVSFVEAMRLFDSPFAVFEVWNQRKKPRYEFENINWNHPENLLLYKKDKKICIRRIDTVELHVLAELQDGASVTEALADYATSLAPDKIAQLFEMMMRAGIIEDITLL